jgi:hypothetical protein
MKFKATSKIMAMGMSLLTVLSVSTTATLSEESKPKSQIQFVCGADSEIPTTYAYIPGEVTLKPLMSWHSEYLLPGDSASELCKKAAQKLQNKYNEQQGYLLASDKTNDAWKVCLVSRQGEGCNARDSVYLFSLNGEYQSPRCLMENRAPLQCPRSRGTLVRLPGGQYKPSWWPFN